MKICIVGAGAIGGYLGAKLALAGEAVTLIARGSHLEAIQKNGLKLLMADGSSQIATPSLATSDIQEAGLQDIEAGRATEIDAIVGAVAELGKLTQIPTPYMMLFMPALSCWKRLKNELRENL
jgi:2-dehydropantoate 2-reductase